MFILLMRTLKLLFSIRLKVKVIGKENIPEKGPVVICFNHTDLLDPAYIIFAIMKDMWALVGSTHRANFIVKFFTKTGRSILVDRDTVDITALDKAMEILRAGKFLGVSPEGTRSKDGILHKGKFGPAYLAGMTDSLILPLGLSGSFGASKAMLKRKVEVTVRIGEPFKLVDIDELKKDLPQGTSEEDKKKTMVILRQWRDVTNSQIMPKVAQLLPEDIRGEFSQV